MSPTVPAETPLSTAMALLSSGVPLSLLLDLVSGPRSEDLLWSERPIELPAPRPDAG